MSEFPDLLIAKFKPCVVESRELGLTTYIHEDVAYYTRPMINSHWVDALLAVDDDRLIGVNFWFVMPKMDESATSIPAERDTVTK